MNTGGFAVETNEIVSTFGSFSPPLIFKHAADIKSQNDGAVVAYLQLIHVLNKT